MLATMVDKKEITSYNQRHAAQNILMQGQSDANVAAPTLLENLLKCAI